MTEEQNPENKNTINIETNEEKKELLNCDYCKVSYIDLEIFSCNHRIC